MRKRIDFIDLAKGICIVLVVLYHLQQGMHLKYGYILDNSSIFRMPLYFFLSGLFFHEYVGFNSFLKKKFNNLLIPFLAFYLTFTVFVPNLLLFVNILPPGINSVGWHTLWQFINPEFFFNCPIWFLLCLFEVNVLYYIIILLTNKYLIKQSAILTCLVSLSLGALGYFFNQKINIPAYLDSSLTALPFFSVGYLLQSKADILNIKIKNYSLFLLVLLSACILILFPGDVDYRTNTYGISFFHLYIVGFDGVFFILFLSKLINRFPLLNYYGRYSLMLLLTHALLIQVVVPFVSLFIDNHEVVCAISFVVMMAAYLIIIPFMKNFLPYITAQKPLL